MLLKVLKFLDCTCKSLNLGALYMYLIILFLLYFTADRRCYRFVFYLLESPVSSHKQQVSIAIIFL